MTHETPLPPPSAAICQQVQGVLAALVLPSHEELLEITHQARLRVTERNLQRATADEHERLSLRRSA